MTARGDILAGEAPSKDTTIAIDEQKVAKVYIHYQLYFENTC